MKQVIRQLLAIPGLKIECPGCGEEIAIRRAKLFGMYDAYPSVAKKIIDDRRDAANDLRTELKERQRRLADEKLRKPGRIETAARTGNFGQISEQILPAFATFPYEQSECRVLLKPVDYVVFRNLSKRYAIDGIKLVDVKTGGASLSGAQRKIRDCVRQGKLQHKVIDR